MKLDSNNKLISAENGSDTPEEVVDSHQNFMDLIEDIVGEFTTENAEAVPAQRNSLNPQIPQTRTPANSFSESVTIDDIDPSSDLGTSIRNKYMELEEIVQNLKSRLNHVVLDENFILTPENSLEAQLEHDLDTDCQEDLSLQEFLELLQTVNKVNPSAVQ